MILSPFEMSKSSQRKLREVGLSHSISGSETIPFVSGYRFSDAANT